MSVVNTHYHFDHVGGNWEFEEIAIHGLGASLIGQAVPREVLDAYLDYTRRQLAAADVVRPLDHEFLWLLSAESDPRPLPADFDPTAWTIRPTHPRRILADGDAIDLGGRVLRVVHAPGHSPDGICLHDERRGLLFTGDSFNIGPNYAHFPDSSVEDLLVTARRLAGLADRVSLIMAHHYGRAVAEPDLLHEFAAAMERVSAGDVELHAARDVLEGPVLEARFDHFSVTLPDPAAPVQTLVAASPATADE